MKEQYTIGELAKLFHMEPQLLRHYDTIGLLRPNQRNEQNNWRVYDYSQVKILATIRYLRKLNFPLKKIEEYLSTTTYESSVQTLTDQSEFLKKQANTLLALDLVIQKKIDFIRKENQLFDPDASIKKNYPERKYVCLGEEDLLYGYDIYFFHPSIVIRKGSEKLFGAYLLEDEQFEETIIPEQNEWVKKADIRTLPAGCYLCGYHLGDFDKLPESIARLKNSKTDYCLGEEIIAINIIDQFMVNNPEQYQTEIQIPILND